MPFPSQRGRLRLTTKLTCHMLFNASALGVLFLSAGCTAAETGMASSEGEGIPRIFSNLAGREYANSANAGRIYSQIILNQAMARHDHRTVFEACSSLVNSGEFSSSMTQPVIDAVAWLIGNEHTNEAEELLEVASLNLKDNFELLAMRADLRMQSGKKQEALALLREFTSRHPDNLKAKSALATVMLRCGQHKEALKIQDSIPDEAFTPEMRFAYAQALHIEGDLVNAEKQLRLALRSKPDQTEAMMLLALTLERLEKNKEAIELYEKILEQDEDNNSCRLLLLRLYLLQGNIDSAEHTVLSSGNPVKFAVSAASIAMEEKNITNSLRFLERLERREELAGELNFYHASLLYEHKPDMGKEALRILDRINYEEASFIPAMKLKIQILFDQKNFQAAYSLINELIEAHPDDIAPLILAGDTYAKQKEHALAERCYRKALELDPDHSYAQYQLAYQKSLQGAQDEALRMMEKIVATHPENAFALNFIAYYLAVHSTDLDKALDYARRAAEIEPQADFILDSLAWVHYQRKEFNQAWEVIQQAKMLHNLSSEQDPELLEHYGDIASKVGAAASARKGWQDALSLFQRQGQDKDAFRVRRKLENMQ